MSQKITVGEFVSDSVYDEASGLFLYRGQRAFISTAFGDLLVSHIRWASTDPWAVCPKANGGFGQSFCVCSNTPLSLEGGRL